MSGSSLLGNPVSPSPGPVGSLHQPRSALPWHLEVQEWKPDTSQPGLMVLSEVHRSFIYEDYVSKKIQRPLKHLNHLNGLSVGTIFLSHSQRRELVFTFKKYQAAWEAALPAQQLTAQQSAVPAGPVNCSVNRRCLRH
jgi:hypothetical protein